MVVNGSPCNACVHSSLLLQKTSFVQREKNMMVKKFWLLTTCIYAYLFLPQFFAHIFRVTLFSCIDQIYPKAKKEKKTNLAALLLHKSQRPNSSVRNCCWIAPFVTFNWPGGVRTRVIHFHNVFSRKRNLLALYFFLFCKISFFGRDIGPPKCMHPSTEFLTKEKISHSFSRVVFTDIFLTRHRSLDRHRFRHISLFPCQDMGNEKELVSHAREMKKASRYFDKLRSDVYLRWSEHEKQEEILFCQEIKGSEIRETSFFPRISIFPHMQPLPPSKAIKKKREEPWQPVLLGTN